MSSTMPVTGTTLHTQPENRAFYPALDGLRGIAFLMVFLYHYLFIPWGWSGVDLFFVLSGFLITGILFDTRDDRHRVRNFYVRRTLRIFPLYYGVMLVLLLVTPLVHWQISWRWLLWPAYLGNVLHVHNYVHGSAAQRLADFQLVGSWHGHKPELYLGHFWTLCVEEQFYLFWPFVVFTLRNRLQLLWICLLSLPICLAARAIVSAHVPAGQDPTGVLSHITPLRLDALLLGGFVALLYRGPHRDRLLRFSSRLLLPVLLLTLAWAFFLPPRLGHWFNYPYPAHVLVVGFTLLDLLYALLILNAIQTRTWYTRLLSWPPLRWMGRLSYGAYVFHDIPHTLYERAGITLLHSHAYGPTVVAFAGTMLLAALSFRFFESPFLNLKDRLTKRNDALPVALSQTALVTSGSDA